jgi:hypothetical protein
MMEENTIVLVTNALYSSHEELVVIKLYLTYIVDSRRFAFAYLKE